MSNLIDKKLFFAWNMDKEKEYLENKAKEGLHLVKVSLGKYEFEYGEPKDVVYQFDFQMIHKKNEDEYLELFQDWEMVQRFGGWYYFRKDRDGKNDQIYSNIESIRGMHLRLLGFLALVGFPLYYQTIIMFPNLIDNSELSSFYTIFRPVVYILTAIHLFACIKILLVIVALNKHISE